MAKLTFQDLRRSYPYPNSLNHDALFEELGWTKLKDDPSYDNTCAIRLSYCLIRAGAEIKGRLQILKGDHKGKMIEPGQKALTKQLRNLLGAPQVFKSDQENNFLVNKKRGIVSFMEIEGYRDGSGNSSGHIDLIWTEKNSTTIFGWELWSSSEAQCGSHCYWQQSKEILFWEFK